MTTCPSCVGIDIAAEHLHQITRRGYKRIRTAVRDGAGRRCHRAACVSTMGTSAAQCRRRSRSLRRVQARGHSISSGSTVSKVPLTKASPSRTIHSVTYTAATIGKTTASPFRNVRLRNGNRLRFFIGCGVPFSHVTNRQKQVLKCAKCYAVCTARWRTQLMRPPANTTSTCLADSSCLALKDKALSGHSTSIIWLSLICECNPEIRR